MINIQNSDDNECFKWPLVRYLNLADHNPARIKKLTKILLIRDIPEKTKNNFIGISVFGRENEEKHQT